MMLKIEKTLILLRGFTLSFIWLLVIVANTPLGRKDRFAYAIQACISHVGKIIRNTIEFFYDRMFHMVVNY